MKILLDIDGVMIPAQPWRPHEIAPDGFGLFGKMAVENLNKIIEAANEPEIILSTSYKHSFSLPQWKHILAHRGIIDVPLSRLETDTMQIPRIDEIKQWYTQNPQAKFVVLDDDTGLNALNTAFKNKHVVITTSTVGLNRVSAEEAIAKMKAQL